MLKYTTKILMIFSLCVFGGVTAGYAQMNADTTLEVNIPNSFILRDKTFPAGKYMIKPTDNLDDSEYLLNLSSMNGKKENAVFETVGDTADTAHKSTEVVFNKFGDQYFLSKIWVKGETNGNIIEQSKMEKDLVAAGKTPEMFKVNEVKMKSKKMKMN